MVVSDFDRTFDPHCRGFSGFDNPLSCGGFSGFGRFGNFDGTLKYRGFVSRQPRIGKGAQRRTSIVSE
jgi:hypothetical protein